MRNMKGRTINKTLRTQHRQRVREATERGPRGLHQLSKWARKEAQNGVIPALKRAGAPDAQTFDEKADLLREALFPKPPQADLSDIGRRTTELIDFPAITDGEVTEAIQRAPADKAPGPDGILNRV